MFKLALDEALLRGEETDFLHTLGILESTSRAKTGQPTYKFQRLNNMYINFCYIIFCKCALVVTRMIHRNRNDKNNCNLHHPDNF